jgi:hypothetical protein
MDGRAQPGEIAVQVMLPVDFLPAPTEIGHVTNSSFPCREEFTLSEMHHHEIARNHSQ